MDNWEVNNEQRKGTSGVDLFDFDTTLQELLGRAVKTEIEEAEYYLDLLEKDILDETRPKIEKFIEEEKEHEEEHEEELRSTFEDFYPEEGTPIPEGEMSEVPSEVSRKSTPKDLIEKAMYGERDAEKFYRELTDEFEKKEVRRLLGYLATREREHYEILAVELEKLE